MLWGEAVQHVVWLMNHTSTKAISCMTLYKATFLRKLDLSGLQEWGEKVWIHIKGGDKLGGYVHEDRWLGVDEKSKNAPIYWPDIKTVNVERNVYVNKMSVSYFEGEENKWIIKTNSDLPETMVIPQTTVALDIPQPIIQPLKLPKYQPILAPSKPESHPLHI